MATQTTLDDEQAHRWAEQTLGQAQLGDARRTWRLVKLAGDCVRNLGRSLVKASQGSEAAVEGAYRFARNEAIDPAAIAEAGFTATVGRAAAFPCLLEIQDSTTLSYGHRVKEELGELGGGENSTRRGFWVHSSLLVDPHSEQTVGLVDLETWLRPVAQRGQRHQRKQRPYPDKESFKWQRSTEALRVRLGPELMSRIISVSDRESDVYAYLGDKLGHGERFVVRACWDRTVRAPPDETWMPLWQAGQQAPSVGMMTLNIPQRGGRPARQAEVTVRATRIVLRRPRALKGDSPKELGVNVVTVCEEQAAEGESEPLEWVLLTTEPIDTPEQVALVIGYYRLRWRIEEFHKAWKLGAGVERLRLQQAGNLLRLAMVLAFVAVRLLQLREQMAQDPQVPCDQILAPLEWKVLWASVEKRPVPDQIPSAGWAYYALARLGGWVDSKRTGRVGWLTLWQGWDELQKRIEGFHTAALVGGTKI